MDKLSDNMNQHVKADQFSSILAQLFLKDCMSAALLNLRTGKTHILKCVMWPELLEKECEWNGLLRRYVRECVFMPDKQKALALTLDNIKENCLQKGRIFRYETRIICADDKLKWIEISITAVESMEDMAIVRIRDIDEAFLTRRIIDLFVYRNYDYILLIDSKKDSYIRFTGGKDNIPLPPEHGKNYAQDMMQYNRQYVMPEDYQRVTDNMLLSNVIQKLDKNDTYSFTSSSFTEDGKNRQSRVTFVYSDKSSGLILCARTDVTQIYLEEQEKNQKLAEALRSAQNDPLTGIYNQKATAMLVTRSLETRYRHMAVIFFIDVDNFKMINDTYGHQKGDTLLHFMAQRLRELGGRDGIAGRLGGDEYLLYLPSVLSKNDISEIGQSICRIFDSFTDDSVDNKLLSCSAGISVYPQDGIDYETLVRKADQALYTSKRYGKNQYYFFHA